MAEVRYVCAMCGSPGQPSEHTTIDSRYTTGQCLRSWEPHKAGFLVREDMFTKAPRVEKPKRR